MESYRIVFTIQMNPLEPSMHFRKADMEPSMHFRRDNTQFLSGKMHGKNDPIEPFADKFKK